LARSTAIPDLLPLFLSHLGHGLVPEGIIFVLGYIEDIRRTNCYTLATTVALIAVNYEEPVT